MSTLFVPVAYLVAAALFILSLKWLAHPTTARRGVTAGEIGMALAIAGTLAHHEIVSYTWILVGCVAGSAIGVPLAVFMPMTHVPQRTALSHALGALAAALVGTAECLPVVLLETHRQHEPANVVEEARGEGLVGVPHAELRGEHLGCERGRHRVRP